MFTPDDSRLTTHTLLSGPTFCLWDELQPSVSEFQSPAIVFTTRLIKNDSQLGIPGPEISSHATSVYPFGVHLLKFIALKLHWPLGPGGVLLWVSSLLSRVKPFVQTSLRVFLSLPFGCHSGWLNIPLQCWLFKNKGCVLFLGTSWECATLSVLWRMCYNWTRRMVPPSILFRTYGPSSLFLPVLPGVTLGRRLTLHLQSFLPFWMWRRAVIFHFSTDFSWLGHDLVICLANIWKIQ